MQSFKADGKIVAYRSVFRSKIQGPITYKAKLYMEKTT